MASSERPTDPIDPKAVLCAAETVEKIDKVCRKHFRD